MGESNWGAVGSLWGHRGTMGVSDLCGCVWFMGFVRALWGSYKSYRVLRGYKRLMGTQWASVGALWGL